MTAQFLNCFAVLDFVFVVNLFYTLYSVFKVFTLSGYGGLGRTRTSDLTLIRRAL